MTILKRISVSLVSVLFCFSMVLGSLSFMSKSYAIDDFQFPFSIDDVPRISNVTSLLVVVTAVKSSSEYYVYAFSNNTSTDILLGQDGTKLTCSYAQQYYFWRSSTQVWSTGYTPDTVHGFARFSSYTFGSPLPFDGSFGWRFNSNWSTPSTTFSYSFLSPPLSSPPRYLDYSPFFFPQLPHGEFDGNINVVDGHYSVDLGSVTGTSSNTGDTTTLEHYSFVVPYYNVTANSGSSDFDFNDTTGIGHVQNSDYTSGNFTVTGQTTNTVHYVESGSIDINGSAPVSYSPSFNENTRFRSWSLVSDASYIWFISDTRNKITGKVKSVSGDKVTLQYVLSANNNVVYPSWCIVFDPMGNCIQVVNPLVANLSNTYEVDCTIGTLEQNSDTGIWSCDPLYHGFWLSQDSPSLQDISSIVVSENKKYLANPVFGEYAFTLNFLNAINENISGLRSDLSSLQSVMQSSISNQTSSFINADAPHMAEPDTSEMADYFAQESVFNAPDTNDFFSGSLSDGHYWSGLTWWTEKFNDLFIGGRDVQQTFVAFITATMTLGLAVLIIGRKVGTGT